MTTAKKLVAPGATIEITIPEDEKMARQLIILAGSGQQAKDFLAQMATESKALFEQASELRMSHDSLLDLRKSMRGDCADVKRLRARKGEGGADETEDQASEAPTAE